MEIISYVGQQPKSRFNFSGINFSHSKAKKTGNRRINIDEYNQIKRNVKKNRRVSSTKFRRTSAEKSFVYQNFNSELKSFAPQKVRNPLSVKLILMNIGHGVSVTGRFISTNIKKLLISLGILCLCGGAGYGVISAVSYSQNFTGPLKIQATDSSDVETLNKLMAAFALESFAEVDEDGKLLNATVTADTYKYNKPVEYKTYKVQSGDTISGIAKRYGLSNISTLISVNDIGNVRQLCAGQKLKIPSMDGIIYTVKAGDSLEKITKAHNISLNALLDVNELSSEVLTAGQQLFLPGASMDAKSLKNAMGDRFIMPISAKFRWSSPYGARIDPIVGVKSFHTGTDMACPTGTPIVASMSGKVCVTGMHRIYGNYVIIDHGNGYQTLYAHMSKIIATKGQWVSQGTRIGLVGSTGYSTGPHLHFTVYKNGKMIDPMSILR